MEIAIEQTSLATSLLSQQVEKLTWSWFCFSVRLRVNTITCRYVVIPLFPAFTRRGTWMCRRLFSQVNDSSFRRPRNVSIHFQPTGGIRYFGPDVPPPLTPPWDEWVAYDSSNVTITWHVPKKDEPRTRGRGFAILVTSFMNCE